MKYALNKQSVISEYIFSKCYNTLENWSSQPSGNHGSYKSVPTSSKWPYIPEFDYSQTVDVIQ